MSNNPPIYFFLYQKSIIPIEGQMVIARSEGNVIVSYDRESRGLICTIDQNTKNVSESSKQQRKVSINGQDFFSERQSLNVGDVLRIGVEEYKLFDSFEEAEKNAPKINRRKYKRPNNAYELKNFVNFYYAPPWALVVYFLTLVFTVTRYFPNFNLKESTRLVFLTSSYNDKILGNFLLALFLTWMLSLLHSFLMYLYFNRNAARKTVITLLYVGLTLPVIYYVSYPLGQLRKYVVTRDNIWTYRYDPADRSINRIMTLVDYKKDLMDSSLTVKNGLQLSEQELLNSDLTESLARLEVEMKNELARVKELSQ